MSKISIGTAQFGHDYGIYSFAGKVKPIEIKEILDFAHSKNITNLDTAPAYGNSEKILGDTNISSFRVVTKTRHFKSEIITDNDSNLLNIDFYQSLRDLKKNNVYALLIHNANDLFKPGAEKLIKMLQKLKEEKRIKKTGVSIYNHNQLKFIINNFDIDLIQLPLNILDRRLIENGMIKLLLKKNIEVHARSIFLQGLLLMSKEERPEKFNRWNNLWIIWHEWLNDNNISALEGTIRYATSIPGISKVLVGVDTKKQLEEIIIALEGNLPSIPSELYTNNDSLLNPSNWEKL